MRYLTIFLIIRSLYLCCTEDTRTSTTEEKHVNITNILYQCVLFCGPQFASKVNIWNVPVIERDFNICPTCSYSKTCFVNNNCCPDVYLQFPAADCTSPFVYADNDTIYNYDKYRMISKCPEGPDKEMLQLCIKPRDMLENLQYPPVTSTVTSEGYFFTFKNKYCALCNNVKNFIPWKLNIECNVTFDFFSNINTILENVQENKCTISYVPEKTVVDIMPQCRDQYLINQCNLTGTWGHYDHDIEYACANLGPPFPPYNNVFCYMCNPPKVENSVINRCNTTGLWTRYDSQIEAACIYQGYSEASYPYKNIYCYICNMQNQEKLANRQFISVNIYGKRTFSYFSYDFYDPKHYLVHPNIVCTRQYRQWKYRIDCPFGIPLNLLDTDILNSLLTWSDIGRCSLTHSNGTTYQICTNNTCSDDSAFEIELACITNQLNFTLEAANKVYLYSPCEQQLINGQIFQNENVVDLIKVRESNDCLMFNCKDNYFIYPLQYLFCDCCSQMYSVNTGYGSVIPSWNIFSLSFYTEHCNENEVFDNKQRKCRQIDCFTGKHLINNQCQLLLPGEMYSMPVGYTLPLVFELTSDDNSSDISRILQDEINNKTNLLSQICLVKGKWLSRNSFYVQVDINNTIYSVEIEKSMWKYTSELVETRKTDINIYYDYNTNFYTEKFQPNTNTCNPKFRPLLTKLLFCNHVIFTGNEYTLSTDSYEITLIKYNTNFKFYEYNIDTRNNCRICLEDFIDMINKKDPLDFVYYVVMITCTVVSTVFLILTLITYSLFRVLRTLPGKNVMSLVLSLFLYHILYLVLMTYDTGETTVCQIIGVFVHYFLLSTFCCFTVCTIHMFKVFGTNKLVTSIKARNSKRVLLFYLIFAYGFSALIVVVNVIVSYIVTNGMSYGYGRDGRCFVSYTESFIASVMTPMILTFILNITLYLVTIFRLKRETSSNAEMTRWSKVHNNELSIFAKLFVTTGSSWILFIINVFVDQMLIYVIIAGLNSLQGLYVFIAYICNKRIYRLYTAKLTRPSTLSDHTRSTTLTSVPVDEQLCNDIISENSNAFTKL